MKTGPKFYHKQDHGGSTHNGPIKLYPKGPVFVVAMTYTKLSIFQYEVIHMPALSEYFGTGVDHTGVGGSSDDHFL